MKALGSTYERLEALAQDGTDVQWCVANCWCDGSDFPATDTFRHRYRPAWGDTRPASATPGPSAQRTRLMSPPGGTSSTVMP
jgi:hypothetical protein